jgi:autotransporter translocation and assembly factor TamB
MKRALTIFLRSVIVVAVLAVSAFVIFTKTDFGRRRIRGVVLGFLHDRVHGRVTIGRIEGSVLDDFSLVDIAIADSTGEPFLSAERVSARVILRELLSKKVVVSGVTIIKPVLHVTKTPDKDWNYARIFHSPKPTVVDTTLGFGKWITLNDVTVRGGSLTVQQPWQADASYKGTSRDSVIADALAGTSRVRVDRAPYGLRQSKEFSAINAFLPQVVVADPSTRDIVLNVETMSAIAAPFRPPDFVVRQFAGEIRRWARTR